jgi:hypothetical protein
MKIGVAVTLALALAAIGHALPVRADEIAVTIPSRSGVTESFAFDLPEHAKAVDELRRDKPSEGQVDN